MGFKVDTSFLRYLTMGALGTKAVMNYLSERGFRPIELERYSTSNKIWQTKVKRLRLPDLLCLNSGIRIEVRAKSKLEIKMSDAPNNPERRWMSGLRDEDIIAFIQCREENGSFTPAVVPQFFCVADLLAVPEERTRLGPPKSAAEGAERDRTWKAITASTAGVVIAVDEHNIKTTLASGRNQTYKLNGANSYVIVGQQFRGGSEFLAGLPVQKISMDRPSQQIWNPRPLLESERLIDRYVAVKALGHVGHTGDVGAIENIIKEDSDSRLGLEAAAALCRLGDSHGYELIQRAMESSEVPYLPIEAVFILTELARDLPGESAAVQLLTWCANNGAFEGNEIRQAAIWGLGKAGAKQFTSLPQFFVGFPDEETIHAMEAFAEINSALAVSLLDSLLSEKVDERQKAIAMHLLITKCNPSDLIPLILRELEQVSDDIKARLIAILGSLPESQLDQHPMPRHLRMSLNAVQWLQPARNWLKEAITEATVNFLADQNLY